MQVLTIIGVAVFSQVVFRLPLVFYYLSFRTAELSAALARLQAATEAIEDLRKRVEVFRESSSAKEKHTTLLQSDVGEFPTVFLSV